MMQGKVLRRLLASAALAAGVAAAPAHAAVTFNLTYTTGTSAQWQTAFQQAAARWSSIFDDNVTINLTVGTASLGTGILGQAGSASGAASYANVRSALIADATSAADATAVTNLQAGPNLQLLINRTSNNPNGSGSATPYVDNTGANTNTLDINTANAKALGLSLTGISRPVECGTGSNCDAFIQFSTNFTFDFDGSDGITAGTFDAVGIATHEIGHALGFVSGVDVLDVCNPASGIDCGAGVGGAFPDNAYTFVTTLDLFRYSTLSRQNNALDFTADTRDKYFSIDGGVTSGPGFATGSFVGDGQQASHWKDNLGIGIMDPTAARGELLRISQNDITAFDVIGWNVRRVQGAIPEPSTWAMMIAGFGIIGASMRRRRTVKVSFA